MKTLLATTAILSLNSLLLGSNAIAETTEFKAGPDISDTLIQNAMAKLDTQFMFGDFQQLAKQSVNRSLYTGAGSVTMGSIRLLNF